MSTMKNKFFILLFLSSMLLSHEVYKEIRVYNDSYFDKSYFSTLGIHIDHATITDEYIQFVRNVVADYIEKNHLEDVDSISLGKRDLYMKGIRKK